MLLFYFNPDRRRNINKVTEAGGVSNHRDQAILLGIHHKANAPQTQKPML